MDFTIQYFGKYDQMLGMESVEADAFDEVLDRARSILKKLQASPQSPEDPELMGYVILDNRGRQVARGYKR
jgi:dsDNA-binding SOS-regulon protein